MELIEQEKEAIHISKEAKPFLSKNGKTVNFSCLLLRDKRMILLQYHQIKDTPEVKIEIKSEENSNEIAESV